MPRTRVLQFLLGFATGLALAGCKEFAELPLADRTLLEPVSAERDAPDAPYVLLNEFPEAFAVYASAVADGERGDSVGELPPGAVGVPARLVVGDVAPGRRHYFTLVGETGTTWRVSERRLPLEGADNFRDVGGLPAADGRQVRWGQFYRADKLSELTPRDVAYLSGIGLESIVDLRSEEEIASAPDVLPTGPGGRDVDYVHLPIYNEAEDTSDIKGRIMAGTFGQAEADALLVEVNRLLAGREAYRFAPFMALVTDPARVPVAYHCTSGKDRTGFATYLLLHTLGVDSVLVFDDYLMSNFYRYDRNRRNLRKANLGQYVKPIDPEVLKPLMVVDTAYLQAAVDEIVATHGSVDSFLVNAYGVTPAVQARFRERYLY